MNSLKQSVLKRVLRDVSQGYSLTYYQNKRIYVKHVGLVEQIDIDDYREEHYEKAKLRGIPTDAESLELLIQSDEWSHDKEKDIERKRHYIDTLIENKSGLYLKSQLDRQEELVNEARQELEALLVTRQSLIGNTCEEYADKRCIDLYIIESFYSDVKFTKPVFTQDLFDELTHSELAVVTKIYDEIFLTFTEENFQKLVIEDFYNVYMNACEKPIDFFGIPALSLTHFQLKLYSYTTLFKNIFNSGEEVPFAIRKDPQKILDWARNPKGR